MRTLDRPPSRDLAPELERLGQACPVIADMRTLVAETLMVSNRQAGVGTMTPLVGREGLGQPVGVRAVRAPTQCSLEAVRGRPIVVGRREGGADVMPIGLARRSRLGAGSVATRRELVRSTAEPGHSRLALTVSVVLHVVIILMLVPVPSRPLPLAPEAQQRQVEMVFVQQPQAKRGAPPSPADAASKPDPKATASASPLPSTSTPAQPTAALTTPAPPAGSATPHWQTSMLDDVGDAPADESAYTATSDDMRPTRPDSAYRNMPPRYPEDAARHGQRGVVDIIVHVTPDGRAGQVEVASSSGVASLDHAAVEALSKWHFQPQTSGTVPVPSQFRIAVHYDGSAP